MEQNIKRISKVIIVMLFLLAVIYIFIYNNFNKNVNKTVIEKKTESAVKPVVKKAEIPNKTGDEPKLKIKFNSNEEIKKEYGRLEIVYLFSGLEYTGVVLSVDEFYTIVTVDGLKKIPMKDVKVRVLLD